jgi:hypothetical protein
MREALALGDIHSRVPTREGHADCALASRRHQAIFLVVVPFVEYSRFRETVGERV